MSRSLSAITDSYSIDCSQVKVGFPRSFNALLINNGLKLELRHATSIHF
jgi:hypothetical protein